MSTTTELELAQRMKAAALNATGAYERLSVMPKGDIFDISLAEGAQLDADITALNSFHDEATPANVLALVEALEARDKQIAELSGIISSARKFTSKCAGFGDVGAAELSKIIDRASGVAVEGE